MKFYPGILLILIFQSCDESIDPEVVLPIPLESRIQINSLSFAEGRWVGVGSKSILKDNSLVLDADTAVVATSVDGNNWTVTLLESPMILFDITYGKDLWVAVGQNLFAEVKQGVVLNSVDGENWSTIGQAPNVGWISIAFQNQRFVGLGTDHEEVLRKTILISEDGENFDAVLQTDFDTPTIDAGLGQFILWGGDNSVASSVNGEEWELFSLAPVTSIDRLRFIAEEINAFGRSDCCFGEAPDLIDFYKIASPEGTFWELELLDDSEYRLPLAFGNDTYISLDDGKILSSRDRNNWIKQTEDLGILDVEFLGGLFVAFGINIIASSQDGIHWNFQPLSFE